MARPNNAAEVTPSIDKPKVDQATKDATQRSRTFNGLTSKEWTLLSKNVVNEDDLFNPVWNDLSSPRNDHQKEHGAVFPVKLAERLIMMYSKEGDTVFDPFLGIGSTAIAAHFHGRNAAGIELNPKFFGIANNWIVEECGLFDPGFKYEIYNDDCRNMLKYYKKESIQRLLMLLSIGFSFLMVSELFLYLIQVPRAVMQFYHILSTGKRRSVFTWIQSLCLLQLLILTWS